MHIRIIAFGALLVIGNVSLANQEIFIEFNTETQKSQKRQRKNLENDIAAHLTGKGLEAETAKSMVKSRNINPDMDISRLLFTLEDVSYDALIDTLAMRVLHNKSMDLQDKHTLIAIAQSLKGPKLSKKLYNELDRLSTPITSKLA